MGYPDFHICSCCRSRALRCLCVFLSEWWSQYDTQLMFCVSIGTCAANTERVGAIMMSLAPLDDNMKIYENQDFPSGLS